LARNETEMTKVEGKLAEIQQRLGDTELYSEERRAELAQLVKNEGELKATAEQLEEQWLELQQTLEDLQDA
jgi:ATP-binding cassette subfamily F protein 3